VSENPPFEHFFNLADLSMAERDVSIAANADDLARIAKWAGVNAMRRFEARVSLRKLSPDRFSYAALLTSEAVQSCVVTLEPVEWHFEKRIARELHLISRRSRSPAVQGIEEPLSASDDEPPEEIEGTRFDLAKPLLEEFALALDPYPRAPSAIFDSPTSVSGGPESPFAVLKVLKEKD
jgi:hypothetical protein